MKKVSPKQYAQLLFELTHDVEAAERRQRIQEFVQLVADRHQLSLTGRIVREYDRLFQERTGTWQASVETSQPLSKAERELIGKSLERAGVGRVEITETIQPDLIGGLKISVRDWSIDGSIRRKLQSLHQRLVQAGENSSMK